MRENSPIQYELLPRSSERCRQQTASDKTLIQQKWKICLNIFTIYSFQHKTFEILICLTRDARAGSRTLQLLLFNDRTNQEMFSIFFFVDSDFSLFSSEQRELKNSGHVQLPLTRIVCDIRHRRNYQNSKLSFIEQHTAYIH